MPVRDDIKNNKEKLEGKSFKYKASYYWEYYRIPALVVILVGIFLFSLIKTIVTAKDIAFEAVFINTAATPDETEFADILEIDQDEYEVYFDNSFTISLDTETYSETNYTMIQKLMALVASESVDVMIGDPDVMSAYAESEFYADLRDYFDEDTLNALGDKVHWYTPKDSETGEVTGDAYPILIDVTDAPKLEGCLSTESAYFGIVVNNKHNDEVTMFYDYLYSEE